eukprot:3941871-Rhodomonas_salina.4
MAVRCCNDTTDPTCPCAGCSSAHRQRESHCADAGRPRAAPGPGPGTVSGQRNTDHHSDQWKNIVREPFALPLRDWRRLGLAASEAGLIAGNGLGCTTTSLRPIPCAVSWSVSRLGAQDSELDCESTVSGV